MLTILDFGTCCGFLRLAFTLNASILFETIFAVVPYPFCFFTSKKNLPHSGKLFYTLYKCQCSILG